MRHALDKAPIVETRPAPAMADPPSPVRSVGMREAVPTWPAHHKLMPRERLIAHGPEALTDIELLGSSLSRKIWQKIGMIDALPQRRPAPARGRKGG